MSVRAPSSHGDRAVALIGELEALRTDEPMLAQPMSRALARCIDAAIWFGLFVITAIIADAITLAVSGEISASGQRVFPDEANPWVNWGAFAGLLLIIWALEAISIARSGRTLSKHIVRVRVVRLDGTPPTLAWATIRFVVLVVPLLACWMRTFAFLGTGWAWFVIAGQIIALLIPASTFWDNDHRGWHDHIAGTKVLTNRG
jgi:uncharacterized RDD family membrane protein YckC